jgi:natural product precursor
MKKVSKLTLKKDSITNLEKNVMSNFKGGYGEYETVPTTLCSVVLCSVACSNTCETVCYTVGACYISYTYCP